MPNYLSITYKSASDEIFSVLENRLTPFCSSEIYYCPILSYNVFTNEETRKIYELRLSTAKISNNYTYEPGFSIGVLPCNDENIVNQLIIRLGIETFCDHPYELIIPKNTLKKNLMVPKHIPVHSTLRNVLLRNVDIKSVPKKVFLKFLLEFISDEREYKELENICLAKGSEEYKKLISNHSERSLLGLLRRFSSCKPPIEGLLEFLPPLLPRPYSISSSPLNGDYVSIIFNVDVFPGSVYRKGLCSGWLETCIERFKDTKNIEIPIYFRNPTNFKLPIDKSIPIIMIATGTGIAPFRGFLEHRYLQERHSFGESWLFYGFRDTGANYLCKEDLTKYLKSGVLNELSECVSRQSEQKQYVQDNIEIYGVKLCSLIVEENAVVYVCGDFSKVLPAVKASFLNLLMKYHDLTVEGAQVYLQNMEKQQKYITESWE